MSLPKSIKIGYARFFDRIYTPALLRARTKQLFEWITGGQLKIRIGGVYPLAEAARARADKPRHDRQAPADPTTANRHRGARPRGRP